MHRFHILNFGCRANQADGAALEEQLLRRGFQSATDGEPADIVVLNSCTVTAGADYGVRQAARRAHRENPDARILVTGCYAQRCPEELAALPGVACVVGNSHKTEIARLLAEQSSSASEAAPLALPETSPDLAPGESLDHDFQSVARRLGSSVPAAGPSLTEPLYGTVPRIFRGDIFAPSEFLSIPGVGVTARTRPNLKIQDGCNNRCSFCIIPYVRGRSRSLPLPEVLIRIHALCQAGYREVVLSGINLGRYGRDLDRGRGGKWRLAQLVRAILEETPLERLRLSSVEPMDFTDELLDLMAGSARVAKHVHAPLQSGSERILRLMRRKYHPHNYRERIEAAFERMPNAAFGADVMAGFPGERDEDFDQTRSFIDSLPFTYLHVFPFSRRPGTPADKMDGQANGAVIRRRVGILREMAAEKNLRFRRRQLSRLLEVVTISESEPREETGGSGDMHGGTRALSDNFLNVRIAGEPLPANQLVRVRITSLCEDGLVGELQQPAVAAGQCAADPASSPSASTITSASA